ncbi:MAG: SpoIVB peptidase S55 domain-containing protein, partial [Thermoanaerobaculia bacterium]
MIYRKLFAFLAFAALAATAAPAAEILPVSEIRSGMKGYGVTSFEGTRLERFDVEILGVLREMGPGQDLILARVGSELLEHSGVIAGMSGSPIFIDGKLIGALAYSWQFAKDPIAGITPIEEMLELARSGGTAATAATPASASEAIAKLLEPKREHLDAMVAALARPQSAAAGALPIAVPLAFGSFASDTIDRFGGLFEAGGFMPVPSGSSTGGAAELTDTRFRPGDPIGAVLLQGDFTVAASGTVTHVDGNQVWAFGHPFLDMGAIEFPMAKSEVVAVLPSVARSFKISNTGPVVGALKQDRAAGIYGEIGAPVSMIPVEVTIDGPRGPETYEVELARHPILSPLLLAMVADSVVAVSERSSGERTIMLDCEIELEGVDEPVHVRDGWAGADARQSIPVYLAVLSNYLLSNEFAEAPIERIRLNLRHADDLLVARLVRATVEPPADGRVSPGDTIRVHASLKP